MENKMIEVIAKIAHEANRVWCLENGDGSQPKWDDAPDWQKDSEISGVKFHLKNPNSTPDHGHNEWLKQKKDEGWSYGFVKDVENKRHPCFIQYDKLPAFQRQKNYLFYAIVKSFIDLYFINGSIV